MMMNMLARQVVLLRTSRLVHPARRLGFSTEATPVLSPVNIYKEGQDPVLKPNEEYPEWMHTIHVPLKTLGQLERMSELDSADEDRFIKLLNRQRIKAQNSK